MFALLAVNYKIFKSCLLSVVSSVLALQLRYIFISGRLQLYLSEFIGVGCWAERAESLKEERGSAEFRCCKALPLYVMP